MALETYKALTLLLQDDSDSYDAVINRLIQQSNASPSIHISAPDPQMARWFEYGVELPVNTQLRRRYKGREYLATVQPNGLLLEGKEYPSLSAAAYSITDYNVNGWDFWSYLNSKSGKWESLGKLRDS